MGEALRVLIVDDVEDDAELLVRELRRGGYDVAWERVDSASAMTAALIRQEWDLIISDFSLPGFGGPEALALYRVRGLETPFIMVSGTIKEEHAVESFRAGAHDFVTKQNLARLCPAVARERREVGVRRSRRDALAEVERQRETLHQTQKLAAMGQLLAGVAHELNNPLSVVMGQAGILQRALGGRPEAARLDKIQKAAERCARIVKNFLALARQTAPERRNANLNLIVEEATELFAHLLRTDGIEIQLRLDPELPQTWADEHQIQQVVINLLTNAHHALRGHAGERRITIETRCEPSARRIFFELSDTGPGIPADLRPRIFEPFFTTKPAGEGTGLGLSLCRGIVEGHGGSFALDESYTRGALFRMTLPLAGAPAATPTTAPASVAERSSAMRILLAEDDPAMRELVAEVLTEDGYNVDAVEDGDVALERLRRTPYDLVISDVRMRRLDGPGLFREAALLCPGMQKRFIFITGDTLTPSTRDFLDIGGSFQLLKPFAPADILRTVARALESLGAWRHSP